MKVKKEKQNSDQLEKLIDKAAVTCGFVAIGLVAMAELVRKLNEMCKCGHKYHTHNNHEGKCFVKDCDCKIFENAPEPKTI